MISEAPENVSWQQLWQKELEVERFLAGEKLSCTCMSKTLLVIQGVPVKWGFYIYTFGSFREGRQGFETQLHNCACRDLCYGPWR